MLFLVLSPSVSKHSFIHTSKPLADSLSSMQVGKNCPKKCCCTTCWMFILQCDESHHAKSDTGAFSWPTAAISVIRMSFSEVLWVKLPSAQAQHSHWKPPVLVHQGWNALIYILNVSWGNLKSRILGLPSSKMSINRCDPFREEVTSCLFSLK